MDALRVGTLGARSASLVSVMFRSLYGEESAELAVADPKAWGLDKVCVCVRVSSYSVLVSRLSFFFVFCVAGRYKEAGFFSTRP